MLGSIRRTRSLVSAALSVCSIFVLARCSEGPLTTESGALSNAHPSATLGDALTDFDFLQPAIIDVDGANDVPAQSDLNAFTRADGKMMLTMRADLEVLVQFLVEYHRTALGAFGPKALRDLALLGFGRRQPRFLRKSGAPTGGRSERRFGGFETEGLFVKRGRRHTQTIGAL